MARKKKSGPTEKEMEILSILWKCGASTVREVNTLMNHDEETGYTTTLKLMQIMVEKRLLNRDEASKTHIYYPAQPEEQIQTQIVDQMVDRVFSGSAEKMMMRVLSSQRVTPEELSSIKRMIREKEQQTQS